jgi:hypothetical protein
MEDSLFVSCPALETITLACTTPPTTPDGTFTAYDATVYVPVGTAEVYRQHPIWSRFANIVEGTITGIGGKKVNEVNIYARDGRIVVEGADGERLQVFDMRGHQLTANSQQPVGIYMVKVGNHTTRKVVVTQIH